MYVKSFLVNAKKKKKLHLQLPRLWDRYCVTLV